MNRGFPTWIELAVLGYCGWQSWDLEWASTPAMRRGGLAFVLWCMPVAWNQWQALRHNQPKGYTVILLLAAIVLSTLGSLGSLHVLQHAGLACALAGTLPFSWPMLIWLPSALSWMPASGWLLRYFSIPMIHLIQFALVLFGTGTLLSWQWKRRS